MTAVVLFQQGLDVRLPLAPGDGEVTQLGGSRVVVVNPADRCALEWALRLAPAVTALALGPPDWTEALRLALARGACRAVRVWEPGLDRLDVRATARVLARALARLQPRLVLAGERGLAGATALVPALVAAHLGWPCLEGALEVTVDDHERLLITRRVERGAREEIEATIPAVVTVGPEAAEPRYVSVRARRAVACDAVETWTAAHLGLSVAQVLGWSRSEVVRVDWPRPRPRRSAVPPRAASAAERLRQLLAAAGGVSAAGGPGPSERVPGTPSTAGAEPAGTGSPAPDPRSAAFEGVPPPVARGRRRELRHGDPRRLAQEIIGFLEARRLLP